jgi:hypothetical protein
MLTVICRQNILRTITTSISPSNSLTSGISSTSTPVSRKSTVEQLKPKQKNQLKLRNNQKKTGRQQYVSLHYISEFLVLYSDSFC